MNVQAETKREASESGTFILLIDDSASIREVLRAALESDGFRVLEAADGRENVRRIMARVSSRPPRISETRGL